MTRPEPVTTKIEIKGVGQNSGPMRTKAESAEELTRLYHAQCIGTVDLSRLAGQGGGVG